MVFCNNKTEFLNKYVPLSHNPYFNRWFSAIKKEITENLYHNDVTILILIDGFLQLYTMNNILIYNNSHNPYFNRWFSAILPIKKKKRPIKEVTILILIDGFLQ